MFSVVLGARSGSVPHWSRKRQLTCARFLRCPSFGLCPIWAASCATQLSRWPRATTGAARALDHGCQPDA
eukprot:3383954-Pyramimonas_sp.AAC.1